MAFKMKGKSVIKGTSGHSALLAKAQDMTLTHGADPTLLQASQMYGESNSPDVIDYTIKQHKIDWGETTPDPNAPDLTLNEAKRKQALIDEEAARLRLLEEQEKALKKDIEPDEEKDDLDDFPGGEDDPNKGDTMVSSKYSDEFKCKGGDPYNYRVKKGEDGDTVEFQSRDNKSGRTKGEWYEVENEDAVEKIMKDYPGSNTK